VRFFFPDSQDQIDPHFDFVSEEHHVHRIRQRDDFYAHEALTVRPFDGLLVAKPIVDGHGSGASGHYNNAARARLYREGVQKFFRLDKSDHHITTLGDCGAFTYVNEEVPPYTVDEVIDFYDGCGFNAGVAPDHIVFGFVRGERFVGHEMEPEWERRRHLTLDNAREFLKRHQQRHCTFIPYAAAHGWSADTYADSVDQLQKMGYSFIAMGGMVPLKTADIVATLEVVDDVLKPDTQLHLLGVTRTEEIPRFAELGVTSFDSTSPFRQAFKDDKDNFYTFDSTYVALRVPQVDANAKLKRLIAAGRINQGLAIKAERHCLSSLRLYDEGKEELEVVLEALMDYEIMLGGPATHEKDYKRTLEDMPWKGCNCGLCAKDGIDVAVFRGSERNKRRGFHNLCVFRQRLDRTLGAAK